MGKKVREGGNRTPRPLQPPTPPTSNLQDVTSFFATANLLDLTYIKPDGDSGHSITYCLTTSNGGSVSLHMFVGRVRLR